MSDLPDSKARAELRKTAFQELNYHWRHCLRCKLADKRLEIDSGRSKGASEVPLIAAGDGYHEDVVPESVLHVLYPCPDPEQYDYGNVGGGFGQVQSRSHLLVSLTWDLLQDWLPFEFSEVTFSFAVGCRPVNFADPRRIMAPKQEWLKACAPKWQTEIKLADPDLVLLCGRHALASVRRDLATKFNDYVGEVVEFSVHGDHAPLTYCGYVAPSPEDIVTNTRRDQYSIEGWEFSPQPNHITQPFHYWCWHVLYACWLSDTLRRLRCKEPVGPDTSIWGDLVLKFGEFYDNQHSIREVLDRVRREVLDETSGPGARAVQTDGDTFKSLAGEDEHEEIEYGDEEKEDDEE